jgi:DNA-binding NarL/FixJ family response regulator
MADGFFGRSAEMEQLRELMTAAFRDGEPGLAMVQGEPGSGKSRLLRELSALVDNGPAQLVIVGFEPERTVDLAAARELIERLRNLVPSGPIAHAAFELSPAVTRIEPLHVLESVHRALAQLGPVLLVVDDLHWVDDMSVALVHYVIRAAKSRQQPLVVVLASRPSAVAVSVLDSLRRVVERPRLVEIDLRPLSRDDAVRMARNLAPGLSDERATEVWQSSGGNPFWLDLLSTSEHLDADVDRIVADRLWRSGTDEAELLALLALIARPLPVEDVPRIQSAPRAQIKHAAANLDRDGLVVVKAGVMTLPHDLIREAVLRAMPVDRAHRVHERIATWLEATAGDDEQRLLEALEHRYLAGGATSELALRLVESPRRMLGVAAFHRLASIAEHSDPTSAKGMRLREGVASLASDLGEHEEALRRWSECATSNRHTVDAGRAALRASESALELERRREAWLQWDRARACADEDLVLEVESYAQEAMLQKFLERRPDETLLAAGRALTTARRLTDHAISSDHHDERPQRALLRALHVATEASLFVGDVAEMSTLADELAATAAGFDAGVHIRALISGATARRFLGLNEEAEARLHHAWVEVRRRVLPQRTIEVGLAYANVLLSMGKLDEAAAVAHECHELGDRLQVFGTSRAMAVVVPQLIELLTGDWRRAVDGLRAAAAAESDPHYRQHAHRERATALSRLDPQGAADEVHQAVVAALQDADVAACRRCAAEALVRCAEALARIGEVSHARELVPRALISPADVFNTFWRHRAEAAILAASGEVEESVELVKEIVASAQRQALYVEAVWAQIDLGAMLVQLDRPAAVDLFRAAGAGAERMGVITQQAMAEQMLRALGVRTWRRHAAPVSSDSLAGLSDREREIAQLVGQGRTNPEIASTTFLSRKTVERHVSNVFAKLGVRNRAELAALISDRASAPPLVD